jgi:hypothetical protein
MPLVIYSPGFAAHQNDSSCILRELASKGIIALTIYHRDFVTEEYDLDKGGKVIDGY